MAQRRRIVPDNSVLMPAFFQEEFQFRGNRLDLTRRARPLADAIRMQRVDAFAPDFLIHEFLKQAMEKARPRDESPRLDLELVNTQVEQFQSLPITYIPCDELIEGTWRLAVDDHLSIADAWYVACAMHCDAELWLSHEHSDGLAEHAARVHPGGLHMLVSERFT